MNLNPLRRALTSTLALTLVLCSSIILAQSAPAQTAPASSAATQTVGVPVLTGLNGPQGVFVSADGSVWATESGMGGKESYKIFNPDTRMEEDGAYGVSARLVRLTPEGKQEVAAVLPSTRSSTGAVGGMRIAGMMGSPSGSSLSRSSSRTNAALGIPTLIITNGEWEAASDKSTTRKSGMASVFKLEGGELSEVGNTWDVEKAGNADGTPDVHSHPYGVAVGPDGLIYIADAGANAVLKMDPMTGKVSVLAALKPLPGVFPNPNYKGERLTDSVPTAVVPLEDGGVLVSLLSGAPFVPGSAKVVKLDKNGVESDYALGLTMLTDLRRGPDGALYAVSFGLASDKGFIPNSGSVVRVVPGQKPETVLSGLSFPTSLDFSLGGDAYVAVNGVGAPGSGQVLKFAGLAAKK